MNPHRKVQNFHINYRGWYMLDLPYETTWLAYCYEEENEKHTHLVMQTKDLISKTQVIKDLTPFLEIPCEIQVTVHTRIETAFGYHIGLGDKPPCKDFYVITPPDFQPWEYLKAKIMHKPRSIVQHALRNKILLETDSNELVDKGLINLEKLNTVIKNKLTYENGKPDDRDELPDPIPNPWGLYLPNDRDIKKCHYWFWSKSPNRGKSTHARQLVSEFRGHSKSGLYQWWDCRRDTDFIVMDGYQGGLRWADLEALIDGCYDFNTKGGNTFRLISAPLLLIYSNYSIEEVYPQVKDLLYARFNEIDLENSLFC